jgi:hypothetical protein
MLYRLSTVYREREARHATILGIGLLGTACGKRKFSADPHQNPNTRPAAGNSVGLSGTHRHASVYQERISSREGA